MSLTWIRGDSDGPGHQRADQLATEAFLDSSHISYKRISILNIEHFIFDPKVSSWHISWKRRVPHSFLPHVNQRLSNKLLPSIQLFQFLSTHFSTKSCLYPLRQSHSYIYSNTGPSCDNNRWVTPWIILPSRILSGKLIDDIDHVLFTRAKFDHQRFSLV